jgi:hypothetical protein
MMQHCHKCPNVYDDAEQSTVCPHQPLPFPILGAMEHHTAMLESDRRIEQANQDASREIWGNISEENRKLAALTVDRRWEQWKWSHLMDEKGDAQLVFRCPDCGAIVGDPELHQAWHSHRTGKL